jgi:hypothetical protein
MEPYFQMYSVNIFFRWSYEVLLYEIFSLGDTPYAMVQQNEMIDYLESGNRLPQPALADDVM